jgi:peptidoglycan/xylan/chitin deacetylase (PgdA/CDA1 family)
MLIGFARNKFMKIIFTVLFYFVLKPSFSQDPNEFRNDIYLQKLNKDTAYMNLKRKIVSEYVHAQPGKWGEFVKGVVEDENTTLRAVALTFDACGGTNGDGYDKELIEYLISEKIPATLFISGKWIDSNFSRFVSLSRDTLFEIENHGLNHKPCSMDGESAYGIHGTSNPGEAFDEIVANAWKIRTITGSIPHFYRSSTTYINEACARMAGKLGITVISFRVLSGDALPHASVAAIEENVIKYIKPGAIVIMHINHPEWNTFEAMQKIIPKLRQMGYSFLRLNDFEKNNHKN